jgi:hypothetical protein
MDIEDAYIQDLPVLICRFRLIFRIVRNLRLIECLLCWTINFLSKSQLLPTFLIFILLRHYYLIFFFDNLLPTHDYSALNFVSQSHEFGLLDNSSGISAEFYKWVITFNQWGGETMELGTPQCVLNLLSAVQTFF